MRAATAITQREAAAGGRPGSERLAIRCTPFLLSFSLSRFRPTSQQYVVLSSCRPAVTLPRISKEKPINENTNGAKRRMCGNVEMRRRTRERGQSHPIVAVSGDT
jgi:hypothetical protein